VRELSDELVATDESNSSQTEAHTEYAASMNDNNNSTGIQVRNELITHVTSSSSSVSSHLDQWLADVTQRQHGAADRLTQLSCDCTFCMPDVINTLTTFRSCKTSTSTSTTTNKPVFTCSSCARTFASEKYLNMHAALHRKSTGSTRSSVPSIQALTLTAGVKDKWTCEVCGKIFAHTSNYKNHIRTHSDDRPYVCHVCSIGFKERYHLKKHTLFKHTGELNEACRRCGKRFKDSTAVRAHERIHSDARPYTCQRCGKAFKTSECLWHHDHRSKTCGRPRRAVDRPPVLSTTCQTVVPPVDSLASLTDLVDQSNCYVSLANIDVKSFPVAPRALTVTDDNQQTAIKTEDTMFMLNPTEMKYDNSEVMTAPVSASAAGIPWLPHSSKPVAVVIGQHLTGSGVKQRSLCSRCGKQFASSLAFERHLAVHSLNRPYRCHICDVGFKLKVHLKKHNLYRHNSDYPCQCRVCGKPFKDSSAVRLHERIHSSARPFQCACGKSFKTRENLWGHRHRRPCVGRYATCAATCLAGGVSQTTQDALSCLQPATLTDSVNVNATVRAPTFDVHPDSNDTAVVCSVADSLVMFDASDCINVDSKLLPPFETFIPPLRTTDSSTNNTPVLCYHGYTDWSPTALPHDVIWWSSGHSTVADIADDVRDGDWSSDWQLSRKLSM